MENPSDSDHEDEPASSFSFSAAEAAAFLVRAVRHNWGLCIAVVVIIGAIGITAGVCVPSTYESTGRIFIQEGGALTSTLASGRDRNRVEEGTRGLDELIMARDNLLSVVREAKIYERWPSTRPGPLRIKDQVTAALVGAAPRSEQEMGFVQMLSKAVTAGKDGDASVRIKAQWRDPAIAYDLAKLVVRNFLAARASHELGPIRRAIPFLEEQQRTVDEQIESAIARIRLASPAAPGAPQLVVIPAADGSTTTVRRPVSVSTAAAELVSLSRQLAEVRKEQRDLLEPRRQRASDLKLRLAELRASYSDDHPLVQQQVARIVSASADPPELEELQVKETQLRDMLAARGVARATSPKDKDKDSDEAPSPAPVVLGSSTSSVQDDPELVALQSRLAIAFRKSDEISARLEGTRIELATAEADFEHRYIVVEPPELPTKPLKARRPLILGIVLLVSLIGAVLTALVRELRRGRITEIWQVRDLGIELLGEVTVQRLMPPTKE